MAPTHSTGTDDGEVPALHELFNDYDPYPAWAKPSVPRTPVNQGEERF